jgi:hypothetical protein
MFSRKFDRDMVGMTDEQIEKEMERYDSYPLDSRLVKSKIEKAVKLSKEIEKLINESSSGGKHDNGCYADEYDKKLTDRLGEAYDHSSRLLGTLQSLKREVNKLKDVPMMKRLTVSWYDDKVSFSLNWTKNSLKCIAGSDDMSTAAERWSHGLHEYVMVDGEPVPRTTLLEHPEFLQRLASYLEKQFPGKYVIDDVMETPHLICEGSCYHELMTPHCNCGDIDCRKFNKVK